MILPSANAASMPGAPDVARVATVVHGDPRSGRLVRSVEPAVLELRAPELRAVESRVVESRVVEAHPVEPVGNAQPEATAAVEAPVFSLPELAEQVAREFGVEDSLVHSVILAESNYNPRAVSPKGALGVMQLIPSTARRFGVGNAFDARQNIEGGVRYLKFLLDYYHGNYPKAIAAYNAGEGAVDKYNGIPPYAETRQYVYRVARNLKAAREERAKRPVTPVPVDNNPTETRRPVRASIGSDGLVYYGNP